MFISRIHLLSRMGSNQIISLIYMFLLKWLYYFFCFYKNYTGLWIYTVFLNNENLVLSLSMNIIDKNVEHCIG